MRRLLVVLLVFAYAAPALLGHGGLHALFGVSHSCCHQSSSATECCPTDQATQTRTCCSFKQDSDSDQRSLGAADENSTAKDQTPAPAIPLNHSADDCTLCQHLVQGQMAPKLVGVINSCDLIQIASVVAGDVQLLPNIGVHVPRGPPAVA